jgi:xeroderma pigmentosum group C-complementing protein
VARSKAYWETEHAAAQKEQEKRQQAVLNRWTKLVQGLRIRQRIREQYGGGTHGSGTLGVGDVDSSPAVASGNGDDHDGHNDEGGVQPATVGGFITGVEDVVQRYSLPRPTHVVFSSPPRSPNPNGSPPPPAIDGPVPGPGTLTPSSSCFPAAVNDNDEAGEERRQQVPPTFPIEDVEEVEMDNTSGLELESTQRVRRMPKSMAALAAEAEAMAQATTYIDMAVTVTPPRTSEGVEAAPSMASRSLRSATRARPRTKPKTKTKATAGTPSRSSQSRKRTRTQDDDGDDDDDDDDEVAAASGGSGLVGWGSESGSDGGGRPRVAKRARKHRRRGSPTDANANGGLLAPVPPSDRVLRTRKGKSPALLAQQQGFDLELAVQRALAG